MICLNYLSKSIYHTVQTEKNTEIKSINPMLKATSKFLGFKTFNFAVNLQTALPNNFYYDFIFCFPRRHIELFALLLNRWTKVLVPVLD